MANEDSEFLISRSRIILVIEAGLMCLINLVALVGNTGMCWSMLKNSRFHTMANLYVFALSVSNILLSSLVLPFSVAVLFKGRWSFGSYLCEIQGFCFVILALFSLQIIALSAVNRLLRVINPGFYQKLFTINRSIGMVIAVLLLDSLALILCISISQARIQFSPEQASCVFLFSSSEKRHSSTVFAVLYLVLFVILPMVTLVLCYTKVTCILRQNVVSIQAPFQGDRSNRAGGRLYVEEIKVTRTLSMLAVGLIICRIPLALIAILSIALGNSSVPNTVYLISTFLYYADCTLAPVIYGFMYKPFRREVEDLTTRTTRRQSHLNEHTV